MFGYFWTDRTIETIYPNEKNSFTSLTNLQKGRDMRRSFFTSPDIIGTRGFLYSIIKTNYCFTYPTIRKNRSS